MFEMVENPDYSETEIFKQNRVIEKIHRTMNNLIPQLCPNTTYSGSKAKRGTTISVREYYLISKLLRFKKTFTQKSTHNTYR